jgi:hypothetical protein
MSAREKRRIVQDAYNKLAPILRRIKARRLKGQDLIDMKALEEVVINLEVLTLDKAYRVDLKMAQREAVTRLTHARQAKLN